MLGDSRALNNFAVDDLERARAFYADTLGVRATVEEWGSMVLHLEGGRRPTTVYPKPDHVPATYTVVNFFVDDLEQVVDELTSRGVQFERYEGFDHDAKGIARRPNAPAVAWFKDPAGNVLAVLDEVR
jgi:catechol 2,3-dioxygenase-like lactoylglutathione lyase family enzyme